MGRSIVAVVALALLLGGACEPAPARPAAGVGAVAAESGGGAAGPAGAGAPGAASAVAFTAVYLAPSAFDWATYVAEQKGFFRAQSLEPDVVRVGTPNEAARAVVSNSAQVGLFSVDAAVRAIEGGGDLAIVGSEVNNPDFSLIVQPELRDYADLRGRALAIGTPKDGAAVVLRLMLRARGLGDDDYEFASVGAAPNRYAALKARAADGAIVAHPLDFVAVDEGYHLLGRSTEVLQEFMFMAIGANRTWAREQRPALVRYLRALGGAVDWLYEPANREEAIDILVGQLNTSRATVVRTYTVYVEEGRVFPRQAEVPLAGLGVFVQAMIELGDLPGPTADPARYVDSSFLQEARQ